MPSKSPSAISGAFGQYTVEAVSSLASVDGLAREWNQLSKAVEKPNAFMTYGWFRAWFVRCAQSTRSGSVVPYVLVLRNGDSIVGIVPYVRRLASRLFRVRKLEFVSIHADYNDLVLGSDQSGLTFAVVDFLAKTHKQWDVLDLRDLRDSEGRIVSLPHLLHQYGLSCKLFVEENSCPYLSIDGEATVLVNRLSGHLRRTLRNRLARSKSQNLRSRIIENPALEPRLLEKLLTLDRQKHQRSVNPQFIGEFPEVFRSLFNDLGPQGWLYVALLEQEGEAVAYQLGFRCGEKLWDYAKAYDKSFSGVAPGTMILLALLDYGFREGFNEYDFLRGEEAYKLIWSTGCHRRYRVLVWNRRKISRFRKFIYHDLKVMVRKLSRKPSWPEGKALE